VLAAAKKLHNSKPGLAGIAWNGARGTPLGQTFIQVMGSFGQAPIDLRRKDHGFSIDDIQPQNMKPMIDTPAGLATAKYLKTLMDYSPPGILNMAWDERVRVFAQGGAAMTYIWSGRSAIYELDPQAPARGKVGYVVHPHGPGAAPVSPLGGWSLGIPTNLEKDRVPLAWKVITWLTSPEMMKEYTKHGSGRIKASGGGRVLDRLERADRYSFDLAAPCQASCCCRVPVLTRSPRPAPRRRRRASPSPIFTFLRMEPSSAKGCANGSGSPCSAPMERLPPQSQPRTWPRPSTRQECLDRMHIGSVA
jgi:hypothetical protein